jgi:cyclohexadieny/prephenate dehydrogenase / 3-phosphoshikimate 1-carboxyvinyltransferase
VGDVISKQSAKPLVGRLVVVGLGLIGGSFAKGLRESGLCVEVVGVDLNAASRALAVELGVVDRCEADLAVACRGADVIQLAVPILAMEKMLAQLAGMDLGQAS